MILNAISSGFTLYFNNFLAFTKIFLFPVVFIGLLSTAADYLSSLKEDYFIFTGSILAFQVIFLTPLYTGMAILIGRDLRIGSLNKLFGYLIVGAQLALRIFILQVIIGIMTIIGLVLFIIPGLYIQFRFTYSVYYLVLEGHSVLRSMDNLWNESKEVHWSLFNAGVLLTLITISFVLIIYIVLGLSSQEEMSLILSFIGNCITVYLQMILIAFPVYSIYQLILKKN